MNPALLGPALFAAASIYCLVRGVRILKTGTATLADAFPFGGLLFSWVLSGINLRGWAARLAAFPHLIFGLIAIV